MSVVSKVIYKFNEISTKIPAEFYLHVDKQILKIIWKDKKTRVAKTILKNKNKVV